MLSAESWGMKGMHSLGNGKQLRYVRCKNEKYKDMDHYLHALNELTLLPPNIFRPATARSIQKAAYNSCVVQLESHLKEHIYAIASKEESAFNLFKDFCPGCLPLLLNLVLLAFYDVSVLS